MIQNITPRTVFSSVELGYGGYLDCLADLPFDMDVVVKEVGEKLRRAYSILGTFVILYGDGKGVEQRGCWLVVRVCKWVTEERAKNCGDNSSW